MTDYESQIKKIVSMMKEDGISPDEQNTGTLAKYHEYAKKNYGLNDESALQLIYESLLYMKMQSEDSFDPLHQADKFGAGFS